MVVGISIALRLAIAITAGASLCNSQSIGTNSAIVTTTSSPTTFATASTATASTVAATSSAVIATPAPTATGTNTGPYYVTNTTDPNITPSGLPYNLTGPYVAPTKAKYDYSEVLHKSFLFYQAQRSGKLPYQRLAWRGDSCFVCKGQYGEDLSGGYYEAANTMKWGFPLAFTLTQLAFNVFAFGDAMKSVNEYNEALESVRWGTDYLVNAHPSPNVFVGQLGVSAVGNTDVDFGYFGPPEEYEMWVPLGVMHTPYYVTQQDPSSEITGESAAALAAAATLFQKSDPAYASTLLNHSRTLYTFATTYLGSFMNSTQAGFVLQKKWYPSSQYIDELAWAATWLYIATNESQYLTDAIKWYAASPDSWTEYSWDNKGPGCHVLLYHLTKQDQYRVNAKAYFDQWLPGPGQKIPETTRGLGFYFFWGSLSYAANAAFLMLYHARDLGYNDPYAKSLTTYAVQQINYILGDCGRSWIVGFGENSPLRPYHKSSYNSYIDYPLRGQDQSIVGDDFLNSLTLNRFLLYGALVGGPAANDSYYDDRTNYEYTEGKITHLVSDLSRTMHQLHSSCLPHHKPSPPPSHPRLQRGVHWRPCRSDRLLRHPELPSFLRLRP